MERAAAAAPCVEPAQPSTPVRDTPGHGPSARLESVRPACLSVPVSRPPAGADPLDGVADVLERQVLPRLLQRHRHTDDTRAPDAVPVGARWLAALARASEDDALHVAVMRLRAQGLTAAAIVGDWLGPAARELGQQWERDECSFTDVTIGVGRMQRTLHHLDTTMVLPAMAAPRILLLLGPGEQHSFGLAVVGAAFRREGWDVVGTGDVTADDAPGCVAREQFDLVGISVGSQATADRLPALCGALRQASRHPGMAILVGGPFVTVGGESATADRLGADAVAADVDTALSLARHRISTDPGSFTLAALIHSSPSRTARDVDPAARGSHAEPPAASRR